MDMARSDEDKRGVTIKSLSQVDCGWYIAKALNDMRPIVMKGHHHFSGFSLLKSKLEGDIRSIFYGYEVVEARALDGNTCGARTCGECW